MGKYLIYGYGTSGKSVERILIKEKLYYKIYDDGINVIGGIFCPKLNKNNIKEFDTIIISPAISINKPILIFAKSIGIEVISELEFSSRYIDNIVAITGTNGKTSTTELIANMLNNAGYNVVKAGNIGVPLAEYYQTNYDYYITEVSSFQLEAIQSFRPHISVILNIDKDHIDRHKTSAIYKSTKLQIYKNMDSTDYVIANENINGLDDKTKRIKRFGENINSMVRYNAQGYYYQDDLIFGCDQIIKTTYQDNILATICVGKILNIDNDIIKQTINEYQKDEHRLQVVGEISNVTYYDDSKATNIHSVQGALNTLKNKKITLLLGGVNKNLDFKQFFDNIPNNVERVICFGRSRWVIYLSARRAKYSNIRISKKLKDAVCLAKKLTTEGCVLLSPGCASFDEFLNYKERGKKFVSYVVEYEQNKE